MIIPRSALRGEVVVVIFVIVRHRTKLVAVVFMIVQRDFLAIIFVVVEREMFAIIFMVIEGDLVATIPFAIVIVPRRRGRQRIHQSSN